jgi:hypothetical protein
MTIEKIELEISSGCNAACPGCARTQNLDKFSTENITLLDIKRIFPTTDTIKGKKFKFCGVLGDPAYNIECIDMVEYLTTNGGWCQLSTNGGIQSVEWWYRLGKLSHDTGNVDVSFCIDGYRETNHIYRVNTNFKVIERNLEAYVSGGSGRASGSWIFIVFDHNEHEIDAAKNHATSLGLKFATRTGMRNSYFDWISNVKKRDQTKKGLITEKKIITTTGDKEHSKKNEIKKLDQFIKSYKTDKKINQEEKDLILNSVTCKYIHEQEIFISYDLRVWPCCFLWDSYFKNKEQIVEKLNEFGINWNCLKTNSLEDILNHKWYKELLALSWDPNNKLHLSRCIRTCALNKAYHNEIKY